VSPSLKDLKDSQSDLTVHLEAFHHHLTLCLVLRRSRKIVPPPDDPPLSPALDNHLVGVVRETMLPTHVSLWLHPDPALKDKKKRAAIQESGRDEE
jgi:hypothetical protein